MLDKTTLTPSMARQQWLHDVEVALRKLFKDKGYTVPDFVRVAMGFPKGTRDGKLAIGQCWALEASTDKHSEIFISPELGHDGKRSVSSSVRIMGVMAHEFGHAIAGNKAGHRQVARPDTTSGRQFDRWHKSFPAIMEAIGIQGPWTATTEGKEFTEWAKAVIEKIGPFPAGALTNFKRKKDTCRQRKCTCEGCGYIVRTTKKWIDAAGPPICPTDNTIMVCDDPDEEDDD